MRIFSLHVKEVGLFKELNVEFNKGFNFITGPNASGKTSILRNISLVLSARSVNQFRYREDAEVWIDFGNNIKTLRLGYGKGYPNLTNIKVLNYKDGLCQNYLKMKMLKF